MTAMVPMMAFAVEFIADVVFFTDSFVAKYLSQLLSPWL